MGHLKQSTQKLPALTDKAQMDAVKALVASELAAIDASFNGAQVSIEATALPKGVRSVQVVIYPRQLHL